MFAEIAKYSFTVDEYERMAEAGIFRPGARLELIEGEIYEMSPIGSPHAACVKYLSRVLNGLPGQRFIVGVQDPIRLGDFSEPQPDLTLLRWREDFYRDAHPTPADVLLVVEVADTTLVTDRKVKTPLYARAGIEEAWVVNIPEEEIEIYYEPAGGDYQNTARFGRGERAQSPTVPGLTVNADELFG